MRAQQLSAYLSDIAKLAQTGGLGTTAEFIARTAMHRDEVLRTGRLSIVDAQMGRKRYVWNLQGTRVVVPGSSFASAREMYARQVYFNVPGFELNPNDVVFDLGANVGLFTVLAALKAKRVIAVEAQSGFLDEIRHVVEENRVEGKVAVEFGLVGAGAGVFADPRELHEATHFGQEPPTLSMEALIRKHDVTRIDFLKCDIEGSEFALFGPESRSWLPLVRRVAAEVHTEYGDHGALAGWFRENGFSVTSLDSRGHILSLPTRDPSTYLFARR